MGKLFENFEPYDVQATRREARAEGMLKGEVKGMTEDILMLLEEIGEMPDELRQVVLNETDMEVLNSWLQRRRRLRIFRGRRRYNISLQRRQEAMC